MKYKEEREILGKVKKPKDFLIEYKWKDKQSWENALKWFANTHYNPDFQPDIFKEKFETLKAARESIKNRLKKAYLTTYPSFKDDMNKTFRIKNIKTGDIYEYE